MWLHRLNKYVRAADEPLIIEANHYAVSQFAEFSLNAAGSTFWIELVSPDINIFMENAWGLPVNKQKLSLLDALRLHSELVNPTSAPILVLTRAELAPSLIAEVVENSGVLPHKIVISCRNCEDLQLASLQNVKVVESARLRLTEQEVVSYFDSLANLEAWLPSRASGSPPRYEEFLTAIYARMGRALPNPPAPSNYAEISACISKQKLSLAEILTTNKQWMRAFEVLLEENVGKALELLDLAAEQALKRNELRIFYNHISKLYSSMPTNESLLYWLIVIGRRMGLPTLELEKKIRSSELADHSRIRLLVSLLGSVQEQRFLIPPETPTDDDAAKLVAAHLRSLANDPSALEEIFLSLRFYELEGRTYRYAQTLGVVANALLLQGQYREAQYWAAKAIRTLDEKDGCSFLLSLAYSLLSYLHLLAGDPVKARELVAPLSLPDEVMQNPSADGILSTFGDQFAVAGHFATALAWYRQVGQNFQGPAADMVLPDVALMLVRLNETEQAVAIVRRRLSEVAKTEISYPWVQLAWGIAHMQVNPAESERLLSSLIKVHQDNMVAPLLARAGVILALLLYRKKDTEEALAVLSNIGESLIDLGFSGWQLLSGKDEQTEKLYSLWKMSMHPLQINFLGKSRWVYQQSSSEDIDSLRIKEMLYILSRFPEGLSAERLSELMGLDNQANMTIRSHVRHLRRFVPVEGRPYRLPMKLQADYHDLELNLELANIEGVLGAYKGRLLAESDVPFIREERRSLEGRVRNLILSEGTPQEMFQFALLVGDDLALLEKALHVNRETEAATKLRAAITKLQVEWEIDNDQIM